MTGKRKKTDLVDLIDAVYDTLNYGFEDSQETAGIKELGKDLTASKEKTRCDAAMRSERKMALGRTQK